MDAVEALLGALGLTLKTLVAGAVGAFVSLRFFEGLSPWERWTTFLGGWAIAAYLTTPVTSYLELPAKVEVGISLLLGLFGMSLAAALMRVVRETDWISMLKRKTGGGA